MSSGAIRRILEAFFRRWPFYVLLFVAALVLGFVNASRQVEDYTSTGSIFVDGNSLVADQSGVGDGGFFSYLTPAQFTSQELNGLVNTEVFMESVLTSAGVELAGDFDQRTKQVDQLRSTISTGASSENLVRIVVTTSEPELSSRLAMAVIDEFVQFQISVDIAESGASEEFFSELVAGYQQDLVDARREVDTALQGVTDLTELTPEQTRELDRIQEAEVQAEERFRTAVENVEASRLVTLQTETDVRQSYSVFDPPQTPTQAAGNLVDRVTAIAIFAVVGLVLALLGPTLSALLTRVAVFPDDLEAIAPVIAVFPKARRKAIRIDQQGLLPNGAESSGGAAELGHQTVTFGPVDAGRPADDDGTSASGDVAKGADESPPISVEEAAAKTSEVAAMLPKVDDDLPSVADIEFAGSDEGVDGVVRNTIDNPSGDPAGTDSGDRNEADGLAGKPVFTISGRPIETSNETATSGPSSDDAEAEPVEQSHA